MPLTSRVLPFPQPSAASDASHTAKPRSGDEALLGPSSAIARVWSQVRRVAPYFRAALLTGEPGTGAEATARTLHALSPLARLPFALLDTDSANLAFTSASTFAFNEGTAFVPDVDRLAPETQRGLLRRLRQRSRPVRIVASSTTSLRAAVSAGRFNADLAESLSAVHIALPSLRDRREDIPLLLDHLTQRVAERHSVAAPDRNDSFYNAAMAFDWPGNLDQIERLLQHLLEQDTPQPWTASDFASAAAIAPALPVEPPHAAVRMVRLEEIVQEHIRAVLIACHGNKLRAAEALGISRSTLYRMLDSGASGLPIAV